MCKHTNTTFRNERKKESAYFKNKPNVVTQVHWLVVVMHNNRSNIDVDLFGNGKCKEKNERDKSGRKRMTTSEIVKKTACIMIKNTNIREKKNKNNKQISKRSIKWLRVHKWSGVWFGLRLVCCKFIWPFKSTVIYA